MQEILTRAGCFVAIILIGFILRKYNFFQENDFKLLSKIVLKITLPAAIITNFAGKSIDPSLLSLALVGFGANVLYMAIGCFVNRNNGVDGKAFGIINTPGYNIGCFTLPFVQSFLGPMGVIATSLFDTGNALICLGGSFSIASLIKENSRFSVKKIARSLVKSVALDCYVIMTILSLANISLPAPVVSLAGIIGGANSFIAMLMIGVGFQLSGDVSQFGKIGKYLFLRFGTAAVLALAAYHLLPFSLEIRQALVLLFFSPIASSCPAFTGELKGDVGLSSALNSFSILISIVCIVGLLMIML